MPTILETYTQYDDESQAVEGPNIISDSEEEKGVSEEQQEHSQESIPIQWGTTQPTVSVTEDNENGAMRSDLTSLDLLFQEDKNEEEIQFSA